MPNDTRQVPKPHAGGSVKNNSTDMTEAPSAVVVGTAGNRPTSTRSTKGKTKKGPHASAASRRTNEATHNQKLTHLVIDSGAIIKGAGMMLASAAENFWTVPEVVSEIRDKKARHHLQVLPFELKLREPSDEAVRFATGFARQTGDLRSLSRVDLRVIALTYMLERQETGGSHLRTAPVRTGTRVDSKNKGVSTTALKPSQKSRQPANTTKPVDEGAVGVDASSCKPILGGKPAKKGTETKGETEVGADVEALCEGVKTAWTKGVIADEQGGDNVVKGRIAEGDGGGDSKGSGGGDDRVGGGMSTGAGQDDGLCLAEEKEDKEVELDKGEEEQEESGGGDDRVGGEMSTSAGVGGETSTSAGVGGETSTSAGQGGSRLVEEEHENEEVELEEGEEKLDDGNSVAGGKHEVEGGGEGIEDHDGGDDDSDDDEASDVDDGDRDGDDEWEPEGEISTGEEASRTPPGATAVGDAAFAAEDFPALGMGQDNSTTPAPLPTPVPSASRSAEEERSWSLMARSNPAPFKVPPKHDPAPLPAAAPVAQTSLMDSANGEKGCPLGSGHKRPDGAKVGTSRILSSSAAFGVTSGGVGNEDDDGKGWVTPSNIKSHKAAGFGLFGPSQFQRKGPVASSSQCRAGCVTTDFAMQNVILQVGLPLLSLDGMAVRHVKQWILRCAACFKTCTEMGRLFCPVCGNASLDRVSCSLNARTGATRLHLKKNHKVNLRGSKYSIPAPNPTKGRFEGDLLLREDQLLTGIWAQKAKRKEKDVGSMFGENITGDVGMTISRSADIVVGYGRKNPNAARGRERRGKKSAKARP